MASKTANSTIPENTLATYNLMVGSIQGLERKGATMPYTSLNGNMFSFLAADGSMALRLPAGTRDEFIKKHKTRLCEAHGIIMKEYVVVPEKLFKNAAMMQDYFKQSYEYVQSLKPKATTKPSEKTASKKVKTKESQSSATGKANSKKGS